MRDRAAVDGCRRGGPPRPGLPDVGGLADWVATLEKLKAAGRWARLSSELDVIEQQAEAAAERCREAEREAAALLARRDELRGLPDAYLARAAKLGAAENRDLEERDEDARGLLWTPPCDLAAAADAVTSFQQAGLARLGSHSGRRIEPVDQANPVRPRTWS